MMKERIKIIFAEDEVDIREVFASRLESQLDCQVIGTSTGLETINVLESNSDTDLIICDYNMPSGGGGSVYQHVREKFPDIPYLMFSAEEVLDKEIFKNFYSDHPKNNHLAKPIKVDEMIDLVKLTLSSTLHALDQYCKISAPLFLKFNSSCCDIFIKINDGKFLKIINKNEIYDPSKIQSFMSRDLHYLYIMRKDFIAFNTYFTHSALNSLRDKKLTAEKQIDYELGVTSLIHDHIRNFNIDEKTLTTITEIHKSSLKLIEKSIPQLKNYLQQMLKKQNFIVEQSLLISYLGGALVLKMGWGSKDTVEKICLASMLHDALLEDPEHALIRDLNSIQDRMLMNKIKFHPTKMAAVVESSQLIVPDINLIIAHHHEAPLGLGFPRGVDANQLPLLCCLFILIEDFAHMCWEKNPDVAIVEFQRVLKDKYSGGNFRKISEAFKKIIKIQ
jgi:response regulator RpfG family c-di-GMP phosphodiesterase